MLTGVIYGAIVVAWAAYLVPLALRRHDEASRTRSIERFSSAMRILARRGTTVGTAATAGARVVVTPKRHGSRVLPQDPGPEPVRVQVTPPRNPAAERAAAARRRRVLSLLVMLTVVVGLVALLGFVPLLAAIVPLVMIAGFLLVAHLSVRRARKPHWVEVPSPDHGSAVVVRRTPARVEASLDEAGRSEGTDDGEPTITLTAAQRRAAAAGVAAPAAGGTIPAVSTRTADGGSLWDPLPVTLPTYVGAPAAMRTFRTIALGEPGTWTSGHSTEDSRSVAMAAQAAADRADDDDDTGEVPQVVNG